MGAGRRTCGSVRQKAKGIFQGQEVIRWNELQECDSVLTYGEGKGVERTADVIMKKTLDGKREDFRRICVLLLNTSREEMTRNRFGNTARHVTNDMIWIHRGLRLSRNL